MLDLEIQPQPEETVLDFDMESLAAGFADPAWVPQKITCISWSWVGYDAVNSAISTQMGFFIPEIRRTMLEKFLAVYEQADIVTGHNLIRHDLPLLNAESMRLGLGPIGGKKVRDTMKLGKTKGLKKGLDNLAGLLRTQEEKQAMDHQAWEIAYEDPTWAKVISRCESDVRLHKQVAAEMEAQGWRIPTTNWYPG